MIDHRRDYADFCPTCGGAVPVHPAEQFGDTLCPTCGEQLLFLRTGPMTVFYRNPQGSRVRERIIEIVAEQLGLDKEKIAGKIRFLNDSEADSLEVVELVMELEEAEYKP